MIGKKKVSTKQVAAIILVIREGFSLATSHPKVADEWKKGATYHKLASKYLPNLNANTGAKAIGYAIRKLIPEDERNSINDPRHRKRASKLAKRNRDQGKAIFSMSKGQLSLAGQKGSKQSALSQGRFYYDETVKSTEFGIMTEEEYIEELISLRRENPMYTWKIIALHVNAIFNKDRKAKRLSERFSEK